MIEEISTSIPLNFKSQMDSYDRYRQPDHSSSLLQKQTQNIQQFDRDGGHRNIEQVHFERYEPIQIKPEERKRPQAPPTFHQSSSQSQQAPRQPPQKKKPESPQMAVEASLPTSSKKMKLTKLVGKLNKSLEEFFLKDGESSYVDDISMMKHYNM